MTSGLLSLLLGPMGWLYAGAWREAVPAGAGYLAIAAVLSRLPFFLVMPVMMVAMPVSGIVGVIYAVKHNRAGKRQRVFAGLGGGKAGGGKAGGDRALPASRAK
ncbi:MAG: hypothetical protein R2939_01980 [Kofleriaceae bacterium]